MKKVFALISVLAMSACNMSVPQAPSESRPYTGSMNQSQNAQECIVESTRNVQLATPYTGSTNRRTTVTSGPQQQLGQGVGAVAGFLIAKELGVGDIGQVVAAAGGAVAGGKYGASRDSKASYSQALEVVVRTNQRIGNSYRNRSNVRVVVQGTSANDRFLQPGARCLIVGSGNNVRIIAR